MYREAGVLLNNSRRNNEADGSLPGISDQLPGNNNTHLSMQEQILAAVGFTVRFLSCRFHVQVLL